MSLNAPLIESAWFADGVDKEQALKSIAERVEEIDGIKPLPTVARNVISLLNKEDFNLSQLADLVKNDIAIASRVLRTANSAFFSRGDPVKTINGAVSQLGANTVRGIVLSLATMDMFEDQGGEAEKIRSHCVATAALAQYIARNGLSTYPPGIFLAGIMHDIGILMLIQSKELDYLSLDMDFDDHNSIHNQEQKHLGYDHAILGACILEEWGIAEPIPELIIRHHQEIDFSHPDKDFKTMIHLLRFADLFEPVLSVVPYVKDEVIKRLASSKDFAALNMKVEWLENSWFDLLVARNDALKLFSNQTVVEEASAEQVAKIINSLPEIDENLGKESAKSKGKAKGKHAKKKKSRGMFSKVRGLFGG